MAGLLAELAFAFPTQDHDDADGAQNPCTDEPSDSEAVPVIVKRTVFIFWVVGVQSRQACEEEEQAQGHVLHGGAGLQTSRSPAPEGNHGRRIFL